METRLNLLCEAGVIDKDICKGMMQVVNVLETECHLPVCVFRSIRSRIGIEVRSAIRIHSINRELNFFYRF
ncbi:hypothetical protein ABUT51_03655, partial [Escherichia coli]